MGLSKNSSQPNPPPFYNKHSIQWLILHFNFAAGVPTPQIGQIPGAAGPTVSTPTTTITTTIPSAVTATVTMPTTTTTTTATSVVTPPQPQFAYADINVMSLAGLNQHITAPDTVRFYYISLAYILPSGLQGEECQFSQ